MGGTDGDGELEALVCAAMFVLVSGGSELNRWGIGETADNDDGNG